jgi:hypothetical protein
VRVRETAAIEGIYIIWIDPQAPDRSLESRGRNCPCAHRLTRGHNALTRLEFTCSGRLVPVFLARLNDGRATSDFPVGIVTLAPAPIFLLRPPRQDGRRADQSHQGDHRQNAHGAAFTSAGASVAQAGQHAVHIGKAGDDARHRIVGMNFVFEIHEVFVADCG